MPRHPDTSPQTLRVLAALLAAPEDWRHGYDLGKETALPSGTLYPILIRLAERGLLERRWEEPTAPGRPPRHAYRLTDSGAATARARLAERDAAAAADPRRAARSAARPATRPALGGGS
jgi:DNA-binding PadR family transcriptional regulator